MRIQATLIMQAGFGLLALGAFGMVDFVVQARNHGPGYSIGAWVGDVADRVHVSFGRPESPPALADMVPAAPPGWEVHPFVNEDISLVTGVPPAKKKTYSVGQIVFGAVAMNDLDSDAEYRTYRRDGRAILFKITRVPNGALSGIAGAAIDNMLTFLQADADQGSFLAAKDGVWFYEGPSRKYPGAREVSARVGKQAAVTLLTRETGNDGLLGIIAGLDVAALNAMAVEPFPGLGEGGLLTERPAGADPQLVHLGLAAAETVAAEVPPAPADGGAGVQSGVQPDSQSGAGGFLGSLFGGGRSGASGSPAAKTPRTAECVIEQGFKRCRFGD